jgi:hypothetical protein
MVSPHFPPDSTAATHRVRLLAPHMAEHGWEPIVVTVEPDGYEGRLDPDLTTLVPSSLRVVRCRAWSPRWTRRLGIGDLGLRALPSVLRTSVSLMRRERVDAVFITTYPIYTAVVGPILKRLFSVPFVIDLQDPWVGAWGRLVGGGASGAPDVKSRVTRRLAARLEGPVLRAADAIVAVSAGTYEDILARRPELRTKACAAIPIGGDEADFAIVAGNGRSNGFFNRRDGLVHVCSVGTILPMGMDTVRAVLAAAADLRRRRPDLGSRLRLHFFGTSNERSNTPSGRVEPIAREVGVADLVTEHPARVDYLDAVRLQLDADALLLMGSREAHYTASKLYPALLARRPLLALYHDSSSVVDILRRFTRTPTVQLVTFDEEHPAMTRVDAVANALEALIASPAYVANDVDPEVFTEHSARVLAGHLADLLTRVA